MMVARTLLLPLVLVALFLAETLAGKCPQVPYVQGIDQSPTSPDMHGKCGSGLEPGPWVKNSHWCNSARPFKAWPNGPSNKAQQCMKFGRATVYRGPLYGSSTIHKAACNKVLHGSNKAALVAVSTKYLKTWQGGWNQGNSGSCGKCMCIRLHGADQGYNPGLQTERAKKHIGLTFLGQVGDRCAECPDDSIDILQDRPFTYAPFNPSEGDNNRWAPYANAKSALRGFTNAKVIRNDGSAAEAIGTWVADWQWVPCSYTHEQCGNLMKKMGYNDIFLPKQTPGIDSYSMRPVSGQRLSGEAARRLYDCPWGQCE